MLDVRPGQEDAFEAAFRQAKQLIAASPGFCKLELLRCLERNNRYLLLVQWRSLSDHEEGFRGSPAYQGWKGLLHHFYEPLPQVWHFTPLLETGPLESVSENG